jgi:hypothetical protein
MVRAVNIIFQATENRKYRHITTSTERYSTKKDPPKLLRETLPQIPDYSKAHKVSAFAVEKRKTHHDDAISFVSATGRIYLPFPCGTESK